MKLSGEYKREREREDNLELNCMPTGNEVVQSIKISCSVKYKKRSLEKFNLQPETHTHIRTHTDRSNV